jgi:hypothetical protein
LKVEDDIKRLLTLLKEQNKFSHAKEVYDFCRLHEDWKLEIYLQVIKLLKTKNIIPSCEDLKDYLNEKIEAEVLSIFLPRIEIALEEMEKNPNLIKGEVLIRNLNKILPEKQLYSTLYEDFLLKPTDLKDFDYEKLGFLTSKHRRIIELYEESWRIYFLFNQWYNAISSNSAIHTVDISHIRNNAVMHISLDLAIQELMPILNELIKENNLVREDFRLQSIPVVESTFRKASFWKIPILWFFRWFK